MPESLSRQVNIADAAMAFAPMKGFDPVDDMHHVLGKYMADGYSFRPDRQRSFAPDLYAQSTVEWLNFTGNDDLDAQRYWFDTHVEPLALRLQQHEEGSASRASTAPLGAITACLKRCAQQPVGIALPLQPQ